MNKVTITTSNGKGNNLREELAKIVARLHELKRRILILASEEVVGPDGDGVGIPLPDVNIDDCISSQFAEVIHRLDKILAESRIDPHPLPELEVEEFWTIGSMLFAGPIRTIHRGFIQPVRRVPLLKHIPDRVVAYLIRIPDDRDLLDREHHGHIGWHYHYLDCNRSRSDRVLCWDTKARYDPSKEHPLFQEKHAESHARFSARPDIWGDTKRRSIHLACAPDLIKWPINAFRCASQKADPVWPKRVALTSSSRALARAGKHARR